MSEDKIIIVVDDQAISKNLEQKLSGSGYSVLVSSPDSKSALSLIEKNIASLAVISVKLESDLAGLDLAKTVKSNFNIPVIIICSHLNGETYSLAKKVNPVAYFTYPFDIENLFSTIEIGLTNHKLQEEIVDAHRKYEMAIKAGKSGVYEIDPTTFEIDGDELLANIFGFSLQEVKAKGWSNLMPIEDYNKKREVLTDLLYGKIKSYSIEHRVIKNDGTIVWAISSGSLVKNSRGKVKIVGTLTDITERKTAEKKLKEYSEELELLNSSKDKFFSIISHDLRNPFNSLLGFSELLANNIEDLDQQEVIDSAKTLNKTAHNLFNLLTNLLEWSKLQNGNFKIEKSEVVLSEVINYNLDAFSESIRAKDIAIMRETEEEVKVFADRNMIDSAVRNLISNAIKFSRPGGIITVGCTSAGKIAELYVTDSGVGIPDEDKDKLFKLEKQFSTEGTNQEKGTGFGLLLCKDMIEKNGGSIKFKSKKDEGSTFIITLPLI
jgi:PAS domain S-box-containing protein